MEELVFISDLLERLEESDRMGFLNRKKKQSELENSEKIRIKTTDEIINEQQENEFGDLQTQISEKSAHLASITEKLELTKKEYQEVISEIMSSKKKLLEIKKQIQSAYAEFDLAPKQEEHQKIIVELQIVRNSLGEKNRVSPSRNRKNTSRAKYLLDIFCQPLSCGDYCHKLSF